MKKHERTLKPLTLLLTSMLVSLAAITGSAFGSSIIGADGEHSFSGEYNPIVTSENIIEVSTAEELSAARSTISAGTGNYTISFLDDITGSFASVPNHEVTIQGNGHKLIVPKNSGDANGLTMTQPGTVNLENLIIDGGSLESSTPVRLVSGIYVHNAGAVLNINDGTVIENFDVDNYIGGGISIFAGQVNMYGGTIRNNKIVSGSVHAGGGVGVLRAGQFKMYGGTIEDNAVASSYTEELFPQYGGGVAIVNGGQFYMHGGTIRNNSAQVGGGVGVTNYASYYISTFVMDGGSIEGNTAVENEVDGLSVGGGVGINGYYDPAAPLAASMPQPIEEVDTPGVFLKGGKISGNKAHYGGGVGSFLMKIMKNEPVPFIDNEITGNNAISGGGIAACTVSDSKGNYGSFLSCGENAIICNNEATETADDVLCEIESDIIPLVSASGFNKTLTETGSDITGWYMDSSDSRWSLDNATVFEGSELTGSEAVSLKAAHDRSTMKHRVSYIVGDDVEPIPDEMVTDGETATRPQDPARENYEFDGWFTDEECTTPYDFDTPVTQDVVLYAKWTEKAPDPDPDPDPDPEHKTDPGTDPTPETGDNDNAAKTQDNPSPAEASEAKQASTSAGTLSELGDPGVGIALIAAISASAILIAQRRKRV